MIMAPASDSSNDGVGTDEERGGSTTPTPTSEPSYNKGSPPPYNHAVYAMYPTPISTSATDLQIASFSHPTPSTTSATFVGGTTATPSFTNTFLRGILTSIDSKDPVVANAWLDTLLDAIDLLPPDVIKREIVAIAINKGHLSNNTASRLVLCYIIYDIKNRKQNRISTETQF